VINVTSHVKAEIALKDSSVICSLQLHIADNRGKSNSIMNPQEGGNYPLDEAVLTTIDDLCHFCRLAIIKK